MKTTLEENTMTGMTRRSMLTTSLTSTLAAALAAGAPAVAAAHPATPGSGVATGTGSTGTLYYFDATYLYALDVANPAVARRAYDELFAIAVLQGIVNRGGARLYVNWIVDDGFYLKVQGDTSNPAPLAVDEFWWQRLREPGQWLAGRTVSTVPSFSALLTTFSGDVSGYVVWDPAVPATSNVATTVCGVEDLLPLRYDTTAGSLYRTLTDAPGGAALVQRSFVDGSGNSVFTGTGTIPGTTTASSGSAKNDAYRWAKITYLDTGLCTPGYLGYYVDAAALGHLPTLPGRVVNGISMPKTTALQLMLLSNLDYQVSKRSFVFDLSPWDDEVPVDDPSQPLGTDFATLSSILSRAYANASAGLGLIDVQGFTPWYFKYTTESIAPGSATHGAVDSEWRFNQVLSAYNGYTDSDAWAIDGMANASLYTHFPLQSVYSQQNHVSDAELTAKGYLDASGAVLPHRYLMIYAGDYDSSAWTYRMIARYWSDPSRGSVDINWAFNPNLSARAGHALHYARTHSSARDYFIAGNSGAGYLNPGMLETPRAFSALPSGVAAWKYHNQVQYAKWGLAVTGFVIDGHAAPMSDALRSEYAEFSPVGVIEQSATTARKIDGVPFHPMTLTTAYAAEAGAWLISLQFKPNPAYVGVPGVTPTDEAPAGVEFYVARTVVQSPTWHKNCEAAMNRDRPRAAVRFVDARTFFALLRKTLP
jgi:hypothetical protein